MLSTKNVANNDRKYKIELLRDFHKKVFDFYNLHEPFFTAKMAYNPPGLHEKHVHFFESELKRASDIYIELVNKEYDPETQERYLFRWIYNPHWNEEYEIRTVNNSQRIYIPCSELEVVGINGKSPEDEKGNTVNEDDCDINDMTLRDLAAIMLKQEVSNKSWLNKIIRNANR